MQIFFPLQKQYPFDNLFLAKMSSHQGQSPKSMCVVLKGKSSIPFSLSCIFPEIQLLGIYWDKHFLKGC